MVPTKETEASRSGKCYVSGNGGKMRNLGRQDVFGYFTNGQPLGVKMQETENITQTLLSASKLEASGNDVVFSDEGSYIYNRHTDSYIPIRRENGSYKLDFWVEDPDPCQSLTGKFANVNEPTQNGADKCSAQDDENAEDNTVFPRLPFPWE